MISRLKFPSLLCAFVFVSTGPGLAADIKVPDCPSLHAWGQKLDKKKRWYFNATTKRIWLPEIYSGPEVEALFGKPTLQWTKAEATTLSKAAQKCGQRAHKAKRVKESRVFRNIRGSLGQAVVHVLNSLAKEEQKLATNLTGLLGSGPSTETLQALGAVSRMGPGGSVEPGQWRLISGTRIPVKNQAMMVVGTLRKLPDTRTDDVRTEVQKRFDALRQPVVAGVERDLLGAPLSLEGLSMLEATLKATRDSLGSTLPATDLEALDTAAATRRGTIEETLLGEQLAKLDSVPAGLPGLQAINSVVSEGATAALSEARALQVRKAAAQKRQALTDRMIDGEIAKIGKLPGTLDGLRELATMEATFLGQFQGIESGSLTSFEHAATTQYTTLGRPALKDYEAAISDLPETEAGLAEFDRVAAETAGFQKRMRQSLRLEYDAATQDRRAEIVAGAERENARLAKLPLSGAVFIDRHGPKLEFTNRSRVYLTLSKDAVTEGAYEEDGNRVIVRLGQGNMVFTREGAWLKGNGLELERQPE